MRLFTAITLEAPVRSGVAEVIGSLRTHSALHRAVKWVDPGNLHLTLQFLGDVRPDVAMDLVDAFGPTLKHPSFFLALGTPGTFPARGHPRVLWLGVSEGASEVVRLRREVQTRLGPHGFEPDTRPYHPHLTIGRLGRGRSVSRTAIVDALSDLEVPAERSVVDRVLLVESRLSGAGPSYRTLAEMALGDTPSEGPAHSA